MITQKIKQKIMVLLAIIAILSLSTQVNAHTLKKHHTVQHNTVQKDMANVSLKTPQERITAFVYSVQPQKGKKYAETVASYIMKYAAKNNISPYMVATTCYIESEFRMTASGGLGMMQISPSTYRAEGYKRRGLKATQLADNIQIGSSELARHYKDVTSRGGYDRMAYTWGRYNGCGTHGAYVKKSMRAYKHLTTGNPSTWKEHLRTHGPLWK